MITFLNDEKIRIKNLFYLYTYKHAIMNNLYILTWFVISSQIVKGFFLFINNSKIVIEYSESTYVEKHILMEP